MFLNQGKPSLGMTGKFSPKTHDRLMHQDRDEFVQATRDMLAQIEQLRTGGTPEEQLLRVRMRLQTELGVRFPKASMRARAEEEWHAVASKMAQAKTPPEEIRKYLRKKAMDYREPNELELQAFVDKSVQQLAFLGSVAFETTLAMMKQEAERLAEAAAAQS